MIYHLDLKTGIIQGARRWERRLEDMREASGSAEAVEERLREGNPLIYEVYEVSGRSSEVGELIWSTTVLYPGKVGDEYCMTKGHYHRDPASVEVYLVLSGEGFLLLKGTAGKPRALPLRSGSIAHIPPGFAHRMVNTGTEPFIFFAVYPAQAGHDYERMKREGFGLRVLEMDGKPNLVEVP